MTVTKAKIYEEIQKDLNLPRKECIDTVETLLGIMKRAMANGEDVMISGFGKFQVREKRARRGRNPATGEDITLPARRVVTFKCSGKMREMINNKE
jgi:integration host factor subunit alpha